MTNAQNIAETGSCSAFYEAHDVPVNSVLLMRSRTQALGIPRGTVALELDPRSGLISNRQFNESLVQYNSEYEETQGFSPTFNAFHERLARDLIDRFDLREKKVVEIGCGKGDFLNLLCEMGDNKGIGFDPAYRPERNTSTAKDQIHFIRDFFSDAYAPLLADFVCCKMTLEHIPDASEFMAMVRRSIVENPDVRIFFQVPDAQRVLRDLAFWDIYYEHCSYFSGESLTYLFQTHGFEVLNTWTDYDGQYLMIEARIRPVSQGHHPVSKPDFDLLEREVLAFKVHVKERISSWKQAFFDMKARSERIVLWGGGSKAVAFLTTLGVQDEVIGAVDINPHKQGTFLAGTGHPIISPSNLGEIRPDRVIIMNPIYDAEIRSDLADVGLASMILHVDQNPAMVEIAS